MIDDLAIRADGLGKSYMIGHRSAERYTALRDVLAQSARNFVRTAGAMLRGQAIYSGDTIEEFAALQDVSFSIDKGDVVGIVGRNGAGKSTLLKVLSRVTEPSVGRVEIRGRVASLLEVGTGFHPELTGRENIFLNGAILGMTRSEIGRKFDEIVEFAGVERFLDTPVKRYSSGMYVRLAFAVAAHLEPEILVVDEVLAVGDAEFQRKCLGRMQEVSQGGGRTVLLVSHNIGHIMQVCDRAIWLEKGRVRMTGACEEVVSRYISDGANDDGRVTFRPSFEAPFAFQAIALRTPSGKTSSQLDVLEPFDIVLDFETGEGIPDLEISVRLHNTFGVPIFSSNRSRFIAERTVAGVHRNVISIPSETLMPGRYVVTVGAFKLNGDIFEVHDKCLGFVVEETGSHMARYSGRASEVGVVLVHFPWRIETL